MIFMRKIITVLNWYSITVFN